MEIFGHFAKLYNYIIYAFYSFCSWLYGNKNPKNIYEWWWKNNGSCWLENCTLYIF